MSSGIGFLFVLLAWAICGAIFFFVLYSAIRLAIRHERRPRRRKVWQRERDERLAAGRAERRRTRQRRSE